MVGLPGRAATAAACGRVGAVAAALTAFYMFRLYWMTFGGSFRGTAEQAKHVHESPKTHDRPPADPGGGLDPRRVPRRPGGPRPLVGVPNFIEHFLEPAFEHAHHALGEVFPAPVPGHGVELGLMGLSVADRGCRDPGGLPLLPGHLRDPEPPRRVVSRRLPDAPQQVLGGRALRGRLRSRPGARRRQRAPRERPLRGGRGRRRGAAGARRQRPRLGACATWWRRPRTSGTAGSWTAP